MTSLDQNTPLSAERRADIKAKIEHAHTEIGEVASQGFHERFRMSVPAQPDRDTDLIISDALRGAEELFAEVERLGADLKIAFGPSLYFDIQKVLDKALGTDEVDGAGAGIVEDISLVAERMQVAEAEVGRLKAELVQDANERERQVLELIDERDHLHELLDKFAYRVAPMERIGEHSSGNSPWENAFDLVTPAAEVDRLTSERDQARGTARHATNAMVKVGEGLMLALREANISGDSAGMAVVRDLMADMPQPVPDGGKP